MERLEGSRRTDSRLHARYRFTLKITALWLFIALVDAVMAAGVLAGSLVGIVFLVVASGCR